MTPEDLSVIISFEVLPNGFTFHSDHHFSMDCLSASAKWFVWQLPDAAATQSDWKYLAFWSSWAWYSYFTRSFHEALALKYTTKQKLYKQ